MKKYVLIKLIGLALASMMGLVLISFFEVAIYSYLIFPNQPQSFYEAHANASAPYISCIFGFILFFLIAAIWKKRGFENGRMLSILFPLIYLILDVLVISIAGVNWADFYVIFIAANTAKFMGSFFGYSLTK